MANGSSTQLRTVGVVTTSRADFGIYRPILDEIGTRHDLEYRLIVSGSHLLARHGMTVNEIESEGFAVAARVPVFDPHEDRVNMAAAMAAGIRGFASCFESSSLDFLLVLGDRFEMFSAAIAAIPFKLPIAHLHGGELTTGAFDDNVRHATTKLSHLHFTSTETYAARVRQMGEESWRVTVCGAPALDKVKNFKPVPDLELKRAVGLRAPGRFLLVTFHPATLEALPAREQASNLLTVLSGMDMPMVITAPNIDPGGDEIRSMLDAFVASRPDTVLVPSLGDPLYFSAMAHAAVMVGNSSSGIIEAASFGLPVVDIGSRQDGRLKPANVIAVRNTVEGIRAGLVRAIDPRFREDLRGLENPYFHGGAARIVAERLASIPIDDTLIVKRFADIPACLA